MKKLALITAVVLTTLAFQSCRQSDDLFTAEEVATLQKVRDSVDSSLNKSTIKGTDTNQDVPPTSNLDGEIFPPPRK